MWCILRTPGHTYIDVVAKLSNAQHVRDWLAALFGAGMLEVELARSRFNEALATARRAGSGSFDWLVHGRVVIVPSSIAARLPRFGGAVFLSFVLVDPRLLDAPPGVIDT